MLNGGVAEMMWGPKGERRRLREIKSGQRGGFGFRVSDDCAVNPKNSEVLTGMVGALGALVNDCVRASCWYSCNSSCKVTTWSLKRSSN